MSMSLEGYGVISPAKTTGSPKNPHSILLKKTHTQIPKRWGFYEEIIKVFHI